jgi:hypothetical protein
MGAAQREEAAMKRWMRRLAAAAAAISAASCEHVAEGLGAALVGGAVLAIEEGLINQQCEDRYPGDEPSQSLCEFGGGVDDDWGGGL